MILRLEPSSKDLFAISLMLDKTLLEELTIIILEGKSEIQELCLSGNFMVSFDVESLHVLTNIPLNKCNDLAIKYVSEGKTDFKLSNTRHPNIRFTMEKEVDYKIP